MKVIFDEDDSFIVHMISDIDISNRGNLGELLKEIGLYLKRHYKYLLSGFYDVEIYQSCNYFVFEIEKVRNSNSIDFDITFQANSQMLYEFEDDEYYLGKKYFLDGKYYVDLSKVIGRLDYLEFGEVVYGDIVKVIKNSWFWITG